MAKSADIYYKVHPWKIIEEGFDKEYALVSESIFSLGNEYMGTRGNFEEGYSGNTLIGNYFNGIYEVNQLEKSGYKGMIDKTEFIVNGADWLYTRIEVEGEKLDLFTAKVREFRRELDLRTGIMTRSYRWELTDGKELKLEFERFLSMENAEIGVQKITLTPINFSGEVILSSGIDFTPIHHMSGRNMWRVDRVGTEELAEISETVKATGELTVSSKSEKSAHTVTITSELTQTVESDEEIISMVGHTVTTDQSLQVSCKFLCDYTGMEEVKEEKKIVRKFHLSTEEGKPSEFIKIIRNIARKDSDPLSKDIFHSRCQENNKILKQLEYDNLKTSGLAWWEKTWKESDILIEGDELNQQGIRFCIFQMHQTYHGADRGTIIGAKGLTGESYNGNTFWDTESYCLPFYIFNNTLAAKHLLEYRYLTLPQAMERAKALDCKGAFYPIATITGRECCSLWQHASLQLQASTAVAYGFWIYEKITKDEQFIFEKGLPILIEVSRMLASRGDWSGDGTRYGFYGVMGPDEFQMMVNNNCYTNYLGKRTLEYTLEVIDRCKQQAPTLFDQIAKDRELYKEEIENFKKIGEHMYIPYDSESKLFEQHEGYFNLPHIDVDKIPTEEFPLYHHWTYDRIYRNNMIKQPDVLMMMLMYNRDFTQEQLRSNYDYYEPRCIHESSLSPSVHSILASQLGNQEDAYKFFGFATRMDIDNYNRNTSEGLHTTSIAAAWMNIVYGFGGMRSDGEILSFAPALPSQWQGYSFKVNYMGDILSISINKEQIKISTSRGLGVKILIYGEEYVLREQEVILSLKHQERKYA